MTTCRTWKLKAIKKAAKSYFLKMEVIAVMGLEVGQSCARLLEIRD